jgi:hypothetical protein
MSVARFRYALAGLVLAGCVAPKPSSRTPLLTNQQSTAQAVPTASPPSLSPLQAIEPRACGALDCLAFASPEAAFEYVLRSQPRVLALGEAHAQEGTTGIRSSTRRFAEQLMPLVAGKSKHIVIELLLANCAKKTVERAARTQAPVTEHQAKSNQNEFITLGKYAQRLGIEPQALTPECAEYDAAAGEDGVAQLLSLVARQTRRSVEALLAKPEASNELVLIYGGALHNDLYPRVGQEDWSFGPQLSAATRGRYLELDLIVPEFVKDTEAWRALPWFEAFDREHLRNETLLYRPAPGSFVLIFPKTETPPAQGL